MKFFGFEGDYVELTVREFIERICSVTLRHGITPEIIYRVKEKLTEELLNAY